MFRYLDASSRSTVLRYVLFGCALALVLVVGTRNLRSAQIQPGSRITQPIRDGIRVALKGNVNPLALPRYDRGAVPDSFQAERVLLVLRRSPAQDAGLHQFLDAVDTPGSSLYHKWLTPEQFGESYGPDAADIAAVSGWLHGHGFTIGRVSKGRLTIEFSGTAGQIRAAFHTAIRSYVINGNQYYANNTDPQIPAALAPIVTGLTPLNNFRPTPYTKILGQAVYDRSEHKFVPQWTFPITATVLYLGPADFALQYDLNGVYASGLTGRGVTIGIIGASNVDPAAIATYRSFFGLPPVQFNAIVDGKDPGQNNAAGESYVDVELAGAVAPAASIDLYTAADTSMQSGLYLAAQRAVDDDVATVLSTSYGLCERDLGSAGNQFWADLWEQAAAQGQTSFVSSGDGGPAGCDDFNSPQPAQDGAGVNGFASTPWNVAVGGTDFYYSSYNGMAAAQQSQLATYWNLVGTLFPTTTLLQPVPEQPWNDPFGLNISSGGVYNPRSPTIGASSGGPSNCSMGTDASDGTYSSCSGGYTKPSWQVGTGVPSDGVRDLPDVSLFAAAGENDSGYPVCMSAYECVVSDGNLTVSFVGGTSSSTASMAGIMALIDQRYGPQGQADYILYPLAAQHPSAFHDITVGSNTVPCKQGSPNCSLSTATDNTNGYYTLGYSAKSGYNMATGLGSVDAGLLVQDWNSIQFKPTNTSLSVSSNAFAHGTPINIKVNVTGSGGTPSGDVALLADGNATSNSGLGEITLNGATISTTLDDLPGGQYQLTARYAGDGIFAPSASNPISLNVSPENSAVSISGQNYSYGCYPYSNFYPYPGIPSTPLSNGVSVPYGSCIGIDVQPRGVNAPQGSLDGIPTGTVTFTDTLSTGGSTAATLNLDRTGTAEWVPASGFAVGTHAVTATYSGDSSFNAASSTAPLTFTITKFAPGMSVSVGPPFSYRSEVGAGAPVTLSANVGMTGEAVPPTGTVTFYLGTTVVGTATLAPWAYNPSVGTASMITSTLPIGTDAITASYPGDSNYSSATTTSPANVVVMQPATVSASANPAVINPLQSFTVTANVAGVNGQPAPTGGVLFNATGPFWSSTASETLLNGAASFTFTAPIWNPGPASVNVQYSGDTNYAPETTVVLVTVGNPFSVTATPVVISSSGATTGNTSTITVTPENGYTGPVYFACTIEYYPPGAQHLPTCIAPSVNITGASPVTATMTIDSAPPSRTAGTLFDPRSPYWPAGCLLLAIAFLLTAILTRTRARYQFATVLFAAALVTVFGGCGGDAGSGGGSVIPGTTPGNYTFMLEAGYTPINGGQSNPAQILMVKVTIQ